LKTQINSGDMHIKSKSSRVPLWLCEEISLVDQQHVYLILPHLLYVSLQVFTAKQQRVPRIDYLYHYVTDTINIAIAF